MIQQVGYHHEQGWLALARTVVGDGSRQGRPPSMPMTQFSAIATTSAISNVQFFLFKAPQTGSHGTAMWQLQRTSSLRLSTRHMQRLELKKAEWTTPLPGQGNMG